MQKITSVKSSRQLLKVSTVEPHSAAGLFLLVWCVSGTKQYEIGKELFSIFFANSHHCLLLFDAGIQHENLKCFSSAKFNTIFRSRLSIDQALGR